MVSMPSTMDICCFSSSSPLVLLSFSFCFGSATDATLHSSVASVPALRS